MAKVILSMDGLVLKEIGLKNERITIGRKPSNDIQIDNMAISGEHAAIVNVLEDAFLEDMNSTNGTLLNGQPVRRQVLKNGDMIELGKYKLKYLADRLDLAEVGKISLEEGVTSRITNPEVDSQGLGVLRVLGSTGVVRETELTKSMTSLGKPGVQVAVITRKTSGYSIAHVDGKQSSLVNGVPLDTRAQALKDHDTIEIAGVKMEFITKNK